MAKLKPRYTRLELETLVACIYPEERRSQFTREKWNGEGFRHYLDSKIVCIEHFMPKDKPILPGALSKPRRKPAARTPDPSLTTSLAHDGFGRAAFL
jgi:hypothetical protein